jgi:nucleoside-diphosphate-sugar epimerase
MASNSKKILVTGSAGLIGRELCKQLVQHGHSVISVDNNMRFPKVVPEGIYVKSNLLDYLDSAVNKFDIIYHMAAINGTSNFYSNPNLVLSNNVSADLAIFKFAESNPNCKLIYASSSEVVAGTEQFPTPEELDITVNNIHNARWSYRLPKVLGENYLFNSKINFLVVRFFNVFSEYCGAGHFVHDIVEKIKNNNFELQGADETRSFCYVSDAVDALINVTHLTNELINIGSDEEIVVKDAADVIASALGHDTIVWKTNPGLLGSVKRRRPDILKLKEHYPNFNPMSFKNSIDKIKELL